jgi:CheY-like chemotaxis protein
MAMEKTGQKPKILIVDDKAENLIALEKLLKALEVVVFQANSGPEALKLSLLHDFCLVITDIQMPELDGYEFVELLRSNRATATLPVIFVSAIYSDEYHHRKAYDSGAVDFLSKPFVPDILLSKIRVFMDLYEKRQKLEGFVEELHQANLALTRRNRLLETSIKISEQIISIVDLKELLTQASSVIQTQFTYPWVSFWLINPQERIMSLEARTRTSVPLGTTLPLSHLGLPGQVWRTQTTKLENSAGKNRNFTASPGLPNIFSELAIPLIYNKQILGVIDLQSDRFEAFPADDVAALQLLSMQIAVAVNNARLS